MLTNEVKKAIRNAMRQYVWPSTRDASRNLRDVDYAINERAGWAAAFAANAENGRVAVCRSGMDCDCTQYARTVHIDIPVSLFAWVKGEQDHREWLDGPESVWLAKPSEEEPRYASADRALEAYEDGHPSVVYWGDL